MLYTIPLEEAYELEKLAAATNAASQALRRIPKSNNTGKIGLGVAAGATAIAGHQYATASPERRREMREEAAIGLML